MHRKLNALDRFLGFGVWSTYWGLTQGNQTQKRLMNKPDATSLTAASGKTLPATTVLILISIPDSPWKSCSEHSILNVGYSPGYPSLPGSGLASSRVPQPLLALGCLLKDNHLPARGPLTVAPAASTLIPQTHGEPSCQKHWSYQCFRVYIPWRPESRTPSQTVVLRGLPLQAVPGNGEGRRGGLASHFSFLLRCLPKTPLWVLGWG